MANSGHINIWRRRRKKKKGKKRRGLPKQQLSPAETTCFLILSYNRQRDRNYRARVLPCYISILVCQSILPKEKKKKKRKKKLLYIKQPVTDKTGTSILDKNSCLTNSDNRNRYSNQIHKVANKNKQTKSRTEASNKVI